MDKGMLINTIINRFDSFQFSSYSIFSLLAIVFVIFRGFRARRPYPPGPRPLPLIGNLLDLRKLRNRPEQALRKWTAEYGDLTMLWLGNNPMLIVNSAKAAKELLDKKGSIYSGRPAQSKFREKMWPRLMNLNGGDEFRKTRRLYTGFMTTEQVNRFRKYQELESNTMLCDLLAQPADFLRHSERYAVSVIFSATYGVRLVHMDHKIIKRFYTLWNEILKWFHPGALPIDYIPALERLPSFLQPWKSLAQGLRENENRLHEAFLNTLRASMETKRGMPECFGKLLLECQKKENISDKAALDILAMLIAAGSDTSSSVLGHFFKCIALHPEVLKKAHEELDAVVGSKRLPGWDDEAKLPYIRGIVKEVHRWCPIGAFGVPHATTAEDVHQGVLIPKGTIVMSNLASLNRDPVRYKNPDVFDPSRFLDDDLPGAAAATHPDFMKRDHFHYGFGRRLCMGIQVAENTLFIVFSRVLWGFNVLQKPGYPLDPEDKINGLVQKPVPYELDIRSRGPEYEQVMREQLALMTVDIPNFDDVVPFHNALKAAL